jgi:hypothetical protein
MECDRVEETDAVAAAGERRCVGGRATTDVENVRRGRRENSLEEFHGPHELEARFVRAPVAPFLAPARHAP